MFALLHTYMARINMVFKKSIFTPKIKFIGRAKVSKSNAFAYCSILITKVSICNTKVTID